jgi:hypothetical protein
MHKALTAGLAYFAVVFAFGLALGTVRVLLLAPRVGEIGATVLEVPIMLALSWFACRRILRLITVDALFAPRVVMGASAFVVLMTAETSLSVFGFGRSLAEHFETYHHIGAMIGLAGQIAFASFPLLQIKRGPTPR